MKKKFIKAKQKETQEGKLQLLKNEQTEKTLLTLFLYTTSIKAYLLHHIDVGSIKVVDIDFFVSLGFG